MYMWKTASVAWRSAWTPGLQRAPVQRALVGKALPIGPMGLLAKKTVHVNTSMHHNPIEKQCHEYAPMLNGKPHRINYSHCIRLPFDVAGESEVPENAPQLWSSGSRSPQGPFPEASRHELSKLIPERP